jgi:hypothetical protein
MMRTVIRIASLSLLSLVVAAGLFADEPSQPSLDDQLLQDLIDAPTDKRPPKQESDSDKLDRELMQDLIDGEDLGEAKKSPLEELAQRMKQSQQRINVKDTSEATQQVQQEISDRLAQLIEQIEKQKKSSQEGKQGSGKGSNQGGTEGGNPTPAPASESTQRVDRSETIERGSEEVKDIIRRVWGHLPEKMREQMQNSLDDQFLPKYEKLIEDYYRRLAEDRGSGT